MKLEESSVVETNDYKVVIYPSSREMSSLEIKLISEKLYDFLSSWESHGKPLSSSFKIEYKQFIVITIDEDVIELSGCGMDALNRFIKTLDSGFSGLDLLNRMKASYLENHQVKTMSLIDFKNSLKNGDLSKDIQVFDFSKSSYVEYLSSFLLPFSRSWASRF